MRLLPSRRRKDIESVGIHVGSASLAAVRVARGPSGTRILQVFCEPVERPRGQWPAERIGRTLGRARKAVNVNAKDVRATVSSDLAATSFLDMPRLGAQQLVEAVGLQLESHWGSGTQITYELKVLERYRQRCRVFAVSMPMATLRLILNSFLDAHCKIDSMEVDSISLSNLLGRLRLAGPAPVAVLDSGPRWSDIHIVRQGKLAFSRPLVKVEGEEGGPASAAAAGTSGGGTAAQDGPAALTPADVAWMAREVSKTLDYFEIELLSQPVGKVLLIGPGARDSGLAGLLKEQLDIEVNVLSVDGEVDDESGGFDAALHALALAVTLDEGDRDED